ncbi:hypothetical protein [Paenibacillus sp. NPDC058177]|uniref:hypothetical protein n=1 Tax=Paenibacillus sp. NPDC058177 TaxID=3346369 RepID=UPI0036D78E0A
MSANINLIIFTKKMIDLNWLLSIIQQKGFNASINEIESVENWDFDDMQIHFCEIETKEITVLLEKGRIITINGIISNNNFALILNKTGNIYETSVSLATKNYSYLDSDTIDEFTRPFYDEVSEVLLFSEMVNNLIVSALGVEVIVEYNDDVHELCLNSHNVVRWVFGFDKKISNHSLKGYRQVAPHIWDKVT